MAGGNFSRRLFTTACALTHATELVTSRLGTAYFLPALFVDRFTHLGGIQKGVFATQLAKCRSFRDDAWAGHWQGIAAEHLAVADAALGRLGGPTVKQLLDAECPVELSALGALLAPGVSILSERGAVAAPDALDVFCRTGKGAENDAAIAVDALIKVITYLFAAAWPGFTPKRMQSYAQSRRLSDVLTEALAPAMGVSVEHLDIPVPGSDIVHGTAVFPLGARQPPMVLITNGLEGTVSEVLLPALKYRSPGLSMFVMEMPGTYSYRQPLAVEAEGVYRAVIDRLVSDGRVDGDRIGMLGMSFGAYWTTRMAAVEPRLRAAVANGAPADRTFALSGTLGVPEIVVSTLAHATHARNPIDLMVKLRALSLKTLYAKIAAPMLVINGDSDTLVSPRDSIDIATYAPNALLKLYPGDDHCAMGHAPDWFDKAFQFLNDHLRADACTL